MVGKGNGANPLFLAALNDGFQAEVGIGRVRAVAMQFSEKGHDLIIAASAIDLNLIKPLQRRNTHEGLENAFSYSQRACGYGSF